MLLAWRIAIPFIFALLLPPWCEALLLRTTPFQLCWDTYIEVLFTLAYSTRLKEEEGLRGLAQLFSLVQLSRILRFYDENWTAQLIRAALPYPYLHERLINSKRLRLLKITPPPDGIVGVVKPNWKEGGSLEKIAYNEEELVRSMQIYQHGNILHHEQGEPWSSYEEAWRVIPVDFLCAEFDLFLCELAKDPGRRDDFNDGLLFLRLWQRLRLQKIWKYEGLAKEIIKKYASLRPNFDVFFKVTTPILELIKIASQMTSEMEHRREASAFVLDTMRAAMKVPNYLTLPNPCASLEFFINNIDTQDIAPASFIALLDVLKSHNLEICQQVDWDKWVTLFIRLIPYGPILPHEPYQSRFIRWQSHNVIPRRKALYIKEGLRVRGKDIIRLLNRENLFAYCNLLAEPIEISYKERPTAINTIVELCEWLLRNIPSVPPWVFLNRKITNAIFKATIYKFTLTGQWGSNYFDHLIVKLWCSTINSKEWLDSKRLIERRLALKLTKPKVREAIGTILELEDKWFVEHFHHTDEIFHLK